MGNRRLSTWARLLAILALVVLVLPLPVAASQPAAQDAPGAPIEPAVTTQMAAEGQASYWVVLKPQANLSGASRIADWNERGQWVYDRLTSFADHTQAGLDALLAKSGAQYTRYWIVNAIYVTSDDAVLNAVRGRPEVQEILAPVTFSIPKPEPGVEQATIDSIEWNLTAIKAPNVWSTYGDTGQGIIVANIDTGVQYDHPALAGKYRGNLGGGSFDHNYNWYDPSKICSSSGSLPCDNHGHGTHTMGTMVGDDGAGNQIGVAPGARFIMAKGCESGSCSGTALTASAQWILAPTDLNGANPRSDLRPHVVNNSWGAGSGDFWYQGMVQAWVASGIFPAFSIGNSGSGCGTANSPGDYPESYASGAFDINGAIASFSSRGPTFSGGLTKPNIAAPGVSVRSSLTTNSYGSWSGTSMASPHTAATVALMWSAAPALVGDIAGTRAILDQTAVDTSDLNCGGAAANNNVWGEGKLDALAAVARSMTGAPSIRINDVPVTEGNSGATNANFTVSLSAAANGTVTVNWATADGTATASSDYVAVTNGVVTFQSGETTKTVPVQVNGDAVYEPNETFYVNLSNPTGATIADGQGVGTIVNDDLQPIHVGDLDGSRSSQKKTNTWTANVTITVHDASHRSVSNAVVTGAWSGGASGPTTCTTSSRGTCTVNKSGLPAGTASVVWTVAGISKSGYGYQAEANHDVDFGTDGRTITIVR